jgi:hypothetical protein
VKRKANAAASALATLRWKGTTADERRTQLAPIHAAGGRAAWAKMTTEERSAEMKRRQAKRRKKASSG